MALESANYIDGLNASNPAASDAISTADDHLRLIKSTIKNTFPNISAPVSKTAAQINDLLEKSGGTMTGALTLSGAPTQNLHATTKAYVDTAIANGVPSGAIMMWAGSLATVPDGWLLCNGQNGTPDLRNRFIVGAGSTYAVAATGGSADAVVVSHSHSFSGNTSSAGAHTHGIQGHNGTVSGGNFVAFAQQVSNPLTTQGTESAGSHSHSFSGTTSTTGSSGTNANLPPYYALAYIMKA